MQIFELTGENRPQAAALMARIKPEWWDFEGAMQQLGDEHASFRNVGWLLGEDEGRPSGWLLCGEQAGYACLSIECLGYDDHGAFAMERQLAPLIQRAEAHARERGFRMLRYMIGSVGLSCHGQDLGDYWQALRDLRPIEREHYDCFVDYGFRPAGFLPNCYGPGWHAVMMVKPLS